MKRIRNILNVYKMDLRSLSVLRLVGLCGFYIIIYALMFGVESVRIDSEVSNPYLQISLIFGYCLLGVMGHSWRGKHTKAGYFPHESVIHSFNLYDFFVRQPIYRADIFLAKTFVFVTLAAPILFMPMSQIVFERDLLIDPYGNEEEVLESTYRDHFSSAYITEVENDFGRLDQYILLPDAKVSVASLESARVIFFAVVFFWAGVFGLNERNSFKTGFPYFLPPVFSVLDLWVLEMSSYESVLFWYKGNEWLTWIFVAGVVVAAFFDARRRFVKVY